MFRMSPTTEIRRASRSRINRVIAILGASALALTFAGCSAAADGDEAPIKIALVGVDLTNPYYLRMSDDAKAKAEELGVELSVQTTTTGQGDEVESTQIESAVASGAKAILVMPATNSIIPAIEKARDAGVLVFAVDNPVDPMDAVDMSYITGNRPVGQQLGQWVAAKLDGEKATIALLDVFSGQFLQVDVDRDQGFLDGLGVPLNDDNLNGDEAATGEYSAGDYEIVCNQPTQATQDGGRTAMENCLSANPNINVVYTINEPAAFGAYQALEAAGHTDGVIVATFDGSCSGIDAMGRGELTVDAQTYPGKMATTAMEAAVAFLKDGTVPKPTEGLDFFNTGSAIVTDEPVDGVDSISSKDASSLCF
jgi:fructose transport system substrate-binding protein